jgi:choline transport protein
MAPRSHRRYLSYITGELFHLFCLLSNHYIGWLCAISWQSGLAGCAYVAAGIIQGLFVLAGNYATQRWQGSLLTLAFLLFAIIFNTLLARRLPMVEGIFVFCHILGILIFIPVWVLALRREGGSPIVDFYNPGGWASNGAATMVGVTALLAAVIGFDCSVHMGMLIP